MHTTLPNIPTETSEQETIYFVNGVACQRDEIYQTVLDHEFYLQNIDFRKTIKTTAIETKPTTYKNYTSKTVTRRTTHTARFNLQQPNLKLFFDKHGSHSEKHRELVQLITNCLDAMSFGQYNYDELSALLKPAFFAVHTFLFENISNQNTPYNSILHELAILMAYSCVDMPLYRYYYDKNFNTEPDVDSDSDSDSKPGSVPDSDPESDPESDSESDPDSGISDFLDEYDELWDNSKKSQWLESVLQDFLEVFEAAKGECMLPELSSDKSYQTAVQAKLDEYIAETILLMNKKHTLDQTFCNKLEGIASASQLRHRFHFGEPTSARVPQEDHNKDVDELETWEQQCSIS